MTVDEAKRQLGLKLDRELAEFLKCWPGNVYNWRTKGALPDGRAARVELAIAMKRKKVRA